MKLQEIVRPVALRVLPAERRLEVWMAFHGLRQQDLAEQLGVTQGAISGALRQLKTSQPLLERISELTGIPAAQLSTSAPPRKRG